MKEGITMKNRWTSLVLWGGILTALNTGVQALINSPTHDIGTYINVGVSVIVAIFAVINNPTNGSGV